MTPEEIRIAVAEECNYFWTVTGIEHNNFYLVSPSSKNERVSRPTQKQIDNCNGVCVFVSNYPFDLNAMREAVDSLNWDDRCKWVEELEQVIRRPENKAFGDKLNKKFRLNHFGRYCVANATALQRAEAFLRVKGRWRE